MSINENDEFTTENILAVNKSLSASGMHNLITGIGSQGSEHEFSVSVIEVKPNEGVYYDINARFGPQKIEGSYYYFDENNNGRYSTIFVADANDNIIGIGLDNDKNLIFRPNDRQFVEKHIIAGEALGWKRFNYLTGEEYYVAERYIKQKLVYFQDENRYEGYFFEPTLSDSLFDVWKMQYSKGTSKLIEEQMSITSHQFLSSVTPSKIWKDVAWQLQAQGIAVIVGLILKTLASTNPYTKWAADILYYAGHFVTYAICNAIHSYIQERDQEYYIKAQTFHNVDYEGEEELSDKIWKDRYFGDMMTDALLGSRAGIYAPVRTETDKHAYSGEVILAPRGTKTSLSFTLDVSFKKLALDYSQQTHGYFAYSDFEDSRFISFFYKDLNSLKGPISRNSKGKYMDNSIMYLEDMVHITTIENEDTHYDSIVPYMVYGDGTFVPVLQFADSEGSLPVPEFYDEYPIFLSPEQFASLDEDDKYHSVYKVYDGSSDTIQLIPKWSAHTLHSNVVSFDGYLCDTEGMEIYIGNYASYSSYGYGFTFNSTSGEITLSPLLKLNLNSLLASYEGAERYIVLEFFIEKYRSVDDLRDLTVEEVEDIATMQSTHANILEYMYQHTVATKTQQKLSEAAYTVLVTVISTLPFAIGGAIGGLGKGVARGLAQFPKILIEETLEELFLDPWIESYVSGYAEEHGWSTLVKSLAVSFAESSRESFGGIARAFNKAFSAKAQASQEVNSESQSQADAVESASQTKAERLRALLRAISLTALSTIMLFIGAISPVATILGTSAAQIGMMSLSTVKEIRQKELLRKISDLQAFGQLSEENVQNLLGILTPSKVADPQTLLLRGEFISVINNKHSLVSDMQKNKDKSESLLQKTFIWVNRHKAKIALYTGALIGGFLMTQGINALFADSMFGSLVGSGFTLGLSTVGMVYDRKVKDHPSVKLLDNIGREVQRHLESYRTIEEISLAFGLGKQTLSAKYIRKRVQEGKPSILDPIILDSIEFNILSNPFFSNLDREGIREITRAIDEYRLWALENDIKGRSWRYRPHRSGYSNLDLKVRKKMWLLRELQASYTTPGEKIISMTDLANELFSSRKAIWNRFYKNELEEGTLDLTIESYLNALISVMTSDKIFDRGRALDALFDYGYIVFNFNPKVPAIRLILILLWAFRQDPNISGKMKSDLISLYYLAELITEAVDTLDGSTFTKKLFGKTQRFSVNTINTILKAVDRLVTDPYLKEYASDYLRHYKVKYAVKKDELITPQFILDKGNVNRLPAMLRDYLSLIESDENTQIPLSLLSISERTGATRVSSFNNRLTFVESMIKGEFISSSIGSIIQSFGLGEATGELSFLNDLIAYSKSSRYKKDLILGHGSPPHQIVLSALVQDKDWAISAEVPVYLKSINPRLKTLMGHIDLLIIDGDTL
ncbi:MAG: hypothetical protein ACFFCI_21240, partial [Promethearchaeota archaeon]